MPRETRYPSRQPGCREKQDTHEYSATLSIRTHLAQQGGGAGVSVQRGAIEADPKHSKQPKPEQATPEELRWHSNTPAPDTLRHTPCAPRPTTSHHGHRFHVKRVLRSAFSSTSSCHPLCEPFASTSSTRFPVDKTGGLLTPNVIECAKKA